MRLLFEIVVKIRARFLSELLMSNFAFQFTARSLILVVMGDIPLVPCEDVISDGFLLSLHSRCFIQRMCSYALFESSRNYRNLIPSSASRPKSTVSENIHFFFFFFKNEYNSHQGNNYSNSMAIRNMNISRIVLLWP